MKPSATAVVTAHAVAGLPEIDDRTDLAALVNGATSLQTGDIVVITSKVVSKAEGRIVKSDRETAVEAETARVVARRGQTTIARTAHGLTLAAAGVDASNVPTGRVALLPVDPDASARRLRTALHQASGHNVAVVVSDTAGRTWREGQTDIAIGVAGLAPLTDLAGCVDHEGNVLAVTAPAVADEVAALGDLVKGKLWRAPVAVVTGLSDLVLPRDDDGPGAAALVRADGDDMFGLGSREAVLSAVTRSDAAALSVLRRDQVEIDDLVATASVSPAEATPVRLDVQPLRDGTVAVSGADGLATSAALERLLVAATTTQWVPVRDDRNLGRCRIVLRTENLGP